MSESDLKPEYYSAQQDDAPEPITPQDVAPEEEYVQRNVLGVLRFRGDLELRYQSTRGAIRRKQLTVTGLIALAVYDMFLVGDYLAQPDRLVRAATVRLLIVTPIVLIVAALLQRSRKAMFQEACAAALCVVGAGSVLWINSGHNNAVSLQAEPGLLLVLLAMNALLRPDFWIAVAATVLCYIELLLFLAWDSHLSLTQQLSMDGRVFWFAVLSLTTNYALSREQRLSWLQQLRNNKQRRLLAESNRELLSLSYTDRLTGLPNRTCYDQRLHELWNKALQKREPIAAVMVDVDYFKSINDSFGHLYGDRVLQRVAKLLEQSLRAEADFVARFGGEEFVVLLPGSDLTSGAQVAERMRLLVQVAGSPAVTRTDAPLPENTRWSTVSCGVASVVPVEGLDPKWMVNAADAALYRAKQTGRNRVCTNAVDIAFLQRA